MRAPLIGFVIALSPIPTFAFAQSKDATPAFAADYQAGEQALRRGDLKAAEQEFRKVLETAPNDVGAHANLGVIYIREKNWNRALSELETAQRLAPQLPGIRLNIGLAYFHQEDYKKAIPVFESVARDAPDSQVLNLLGLCYFLEERYADAVDTLKKLWTPSNTNLNYLYMLTISAGKAGQHDLEGEASQRLLEAGKDTAELHLFLGRALLWRGEYDKALTELQQAAQLNPQLPFVHYNLALAYKRAGDLERAKEELLNDSKIEPDVAYNYDELGKICVALNDDEMAERYFREAVKRDPRLGTSWFGLAKLDKQNKKYAEALGALESAARVNSDSASLHYLRAQILLDQGKRDEARQELVLVRKLQKEVTDELEREVSGARYRDPGLAAIPE